MNCNDNDSSLIHTLPKLVWRVIYSSLRTFDVLTLSLVCTDFRRKLMCCFQVLSLDSYDLSWNKSKQKLKIDIEKMISFFSTKNIAKDVDMRCAIELKFVRCKVFVTCKSFGKQAGIVLY